MHLTGYTRPRWGSGFLSCMDIECHGANRRKAWPPTRQVVLGLGAIQNAHGIPELHDTWPNQALLGQCHDECTPSPGSEEALPQTSRQSRNGTS